MTQDSNESSSENSGPLSSPSKHEQHAREKEKREQEKQALLLAQQRRRQRKRVVIWIISIILFGGVLGYFLMNYTPKKPYVDHEIHWHATLDLEICGQHRDLPRTGIGEHHKGLPLLHTHDDNTIHVEGGPIRKPEDISLGVFMDAIEVKFGTDTLMEHKNGDTCTGSSEPGNLSMYINDEKSDLFRNYIVHDGDKIKLVFE